MNSHTIHAGLDISKDHLDLAFSSPASSKQSLRFNNTPRGIASLIARLQSHAQTHGASIHVIAEASGGYERSLINALHKHSITVSLVSASRVRQFARSASIIAKTDSIDAHVLARFGAAIRPRPSLPLDPTVASLRDLERQRGHLAALRAAGMTRLHQLTDKAMIKEQKRLISLLQCQIDSLQTRINALIQQSASLSAKAKGSPASRASAPALALPSSLSFPSSVPSIAPRLLHSPGWLPSIAKVALGGASR